MAHAKSLSPPPRSIQSPRETQHLVRERMFAGADLQHVLEILRESSSTGTLIVNVVNGGVGTIHFREEQRVQFSDR